MKIILFVFSLRKGGAERLLLQIANHLISQGYEVVVLSITSTDEYQETEYSKIERDFLIAHDKYQWPYVVPQILSKLREFFKHNSCDLVLIFTPMLAILFAASGIKKKCIHVIQGYGSLRRPFSIKGLIYNLLDKAAFLKLRYDVIVPTAQLKSFVLSALPISRKKIKVLSSGVDEQILLPLQAKHKFQDLNITMLGTVSKHKGQRYAIEVVQELLKLNLFSSVCISIIGSGSDIDYIQRKVNDAGLNQHIKLLGRRDDAFELIARSHIFLHLSESEGLPLVILEAMSMGVPAIGFDVRGVNDIIRHGENGYLAGFGDFRGIAQLLANLHGSNEKYSMMQKNARHIIENEFSCKDMLLNYEKIILNTLPK